MHLLMYFLSTAAAAAAMTTFSVTKDCGAELDDAFKLIPKTSYEILMEHFKVCRPISSDGQVQTIILSKGAATLAMLDYPYAATFVTNMPANPVKVACKRLLGAIKYCMA